MRPQNKRLFAIGIVAAALLLIPYLAMEFTGEVKWSEFDFIVAGVLLFGAGLACEVVLRLVTNFRYRVMICVGILGGLFLVWAELAVGLLGTRFAGS